MNEPDPLERLAGRRRERVARTSDTADRERARAPAKAARARNKVLDLSLESRSIPVMLASLVVSIGCAALTVFGVWSVTHNQGLVGGVGAIVWLGFFLLINFAVVSYERARELRWLEQIPFAIDRERYVIALSNAYTSNVCVELLVEFITPIPDGDRAMIADAVAEACFGRVGGLTSKTRESKATFQGHALQIKSPSIQTSFLHQPKDGDSKTVHHNRFVHRWLRRCVDKGLRAVHVRFPIARAQVSIKP